MIRKTILVLAMFTFIASLSNLAMTDWKYYSDLPTSPDEKQGWTEVVLVNHGAERYASEGEINHLLFVKKRTTILCAISLLAIAFLAPRYYEYWVTGERRKPVRDNNDD